jgi:hypothetical protein
MPVKATTGDMYTQIVFLRLYSRSAQRLYHTCTDLELADRAMLRDYNTQPTPTRDDLVSMYSVLAEGAEQQIQYNRERGYYQPMSVYPYRAGAAAGYSTPPLREAPQTFRYGPIARALPVPTVTRPNLFGTDFANRHELKQPAEVFVNPAEGSGSPFEGCQVVRTIQLEEDRVALHGMPLFRAPDETLQALNDRREAANRDIASGVPVQPIRQPAELQSVISCMALQYEQSHPQVPYSETAAYKFWDVAMQSYSLIKVHGKNRACWKAAAAAAETELHKLFDF